MGNSELKRISELNAAYVFLLRHLAWTKNEVLLSRISDFNNEGLSAYLKLSEEQIQDIYEGRPNLVFSLDFQENELELILSAQESAKSKVFSQLFSDNSAYLKVSECPVKTLAHLVLREIKVWSSTSANTAYRFGCSPKLIQLIEQADESTLAKFALSSSLRLKQKFTSTHLHVTGLTGLIPVSLLFC